jgi:glycyl-tRNA synthetase beta chain
MSDFLLEIGLEEVPARMIAGAEAELGKRVHELLSRERLLGDGAKLSTYSTPRRLAVLAEGVLASQADTEEKLTGPSWKVAFRWRANTRSRGLCEKGRCDRGRASESGDPKRRVCGRDGQAHRARG